MYSSMPAETYGEQGKDISRTTCPALKQAYNSRAGLLNNTEVRMYHMYRPTGIYEPGWDHGRAAGPQNLQRCILTHTRVGPQRQTVSMSKAPAGPPAHHLARCTTLEQACTITLGPGYIICAGLQALADQGDHRPVGLLTLRRERVGLPMHADWDYHKARDMPTMRRHILTCA